jgi:hypothetical protein
MLLYTIPVYSLVAYFFLPAFVFSAYEKWSEVMQAEAG